MNRLFAVVVALLFSAAIALAANWPSTTGTTATGVVLENGSTGTRLGVSSGTNTLAVDTEGQRLTYSAAFGPQTTFGATVTDWAVASGSGTKTIKGRKLSICGTATAAITLDVLLIKRSTADTAGTIGSTPNAVPHDSASAAATGSLIGYTANPTLGTTTGNIDVKKINLGTPAGGAGCIFWQWSDANSQALVLRSAAQQLAVNLNNVAPPAGLSLSAQWQWTEE
jgi:hypothetical protein